MKTLHPRSQSKTATNKNIRLCKITLKIVHGRRKICWLFFLVSFERYDEIKMKYNLRIVNIETYVSFLSCPFD